MTDVDNVDPALWRLMKFGLIDRIRDMLENPFEKGSKASLLKRAAIATEMKFNQKKFIELKSIVPHWLTEKFPAGIKPFIYYFRSLISPPSRSTFMTSLAYGSILSIMLSFSGIDSFPFYYLGILNSGMGMLMLSRSGPLTQHAFTMASASSIRTSLATMWFLSVSCMSIFGWISSILGLRKLFFSIVTYGLGFFVASILSSFFDIEEHRSNNGMLWRRAIEAMRRDEGLNSDESEENEDYLQEYDYPYDPDVDNKNPSIYTAKMIELDKQFQKGVRKEVIMVDEDTLGVRKGFYNAIGFKGVNSTDPIVYNTTYTATFPKYKGNYGARLGCPEWVQEIKNINIDDLDVYDPNDEIKDPILAKRPQQVTIDNPFDDDADGVQSKIRNYDYGGVNINEEERLDLSELVPNDDNIL